MTRQKIAITLPDEQVAAARQAVAEGRAASVSAFISQALARRDADEEFAETIAEIYAESGQPTEEDRHWARRVLGIEPWPSARATGGIPSSPATRTISPRSTRR